MTTDHEAIRNANGRVAHAIARMLFACGARHAVLAPGSRSTPLVIALAAAGFELQVVHDERSGAFIALGVARATATPALFVTTSGSAVVHAYPAIVEASVDGVAMLVLSADRPLELIGSGSNQTMRQHGIFGGFTLRDYDLVAEPSVDVRHIEARARDAFVLATTQRGPVHINVRFKKPLEIDARSSADAAAQVVPTCAPVARGQQRILEDLDFDSIVVGRLVDAQDIVCAARIVTAFGVPTHASITSGLRSQDIFGSTDKEQAPLFHDCEALIEDAVLLRWVFGKRVLWLGGPTVSARLGEALRAAGAAVTRIGSCGDGDDLATTIWDTPLREVLVPEIPASRRDAARCRAAVELVARLASIDARLEAPLEARIARAVCASIERDAVLFIANSAPVRDVDRYVAHVAAASSHCNRGVSGIDGTLSTAYGVALGSGAPVTLLCGDVAFLHDAGSMSAFDKSVRLRVVVIDNHGGGIFERLPIAREAAHAEIYERCIVAAHDVDLAALAACYGMRAQRVATQGELVTALAQPIEGFEVLVIETDRHDEARSRRAHREAFRRALAELGPWPPKA